jgi:hypothetical protein
MASDSRRAKLVAEIEELQTMQTKSIAATTFCSWTHEQEVAHDKRADRLESLLRQAEPLTETGSHEPSRSSPETVSTSCGLSGSR